MRSLAAAVVLALAVAAGAAGGNRSMSGWFFGEGRGIYCGLELFPHEGSDRWLACWRPRNGFAVSMSHRGRPKARMWRWHHRPPTMTGVLRSGETVWVDRNRHAGRGSPPRGSLFWCTVRRTSLTCQNATGYGWRLGRVRGYRLIR